MASRALICRLREKGHSRYVAFHASHGDEVLMLPAERFDPATLHKLLAEEIQGSVEPPRADGTSQLKLVTRDGEIVYTASVWIRASCWERMR